jgi:hypothetical protein
VSAASEVVRMRRSIHRGVRRGSNHSMKPKQQHISMIG